jgi:hypothetical protein
VGAPMIAGARCAKIACTASTIVSSTIACGMLCTAIAENTAEVLFSFLLSTAEGQSAANYQKRGKATGARGFKFFVRTGMSCE